MSRNLGKRGIKELLLEIRVSSYVMCAPFVLLFTTFVVIPICVTFFISFTSFNMLEFPRWVGLDNYRDIFVHDEVFLVAIKNTLYLVAFTGPLGYFLSFVFAWLINELAPIVRSVMVLVFYAPSISGNVYFIWKFIFSGDSYGLANGILLRMNVIQQPIQWLVDVRYNMSIVVLVIIWLSMGAGFLAFIAGLQTLNNDLSEAAAIDGISNRWQEVWYITLPQMVPQLLFGAILSIAGSFAVGYQCMELTGFPSTDNSTTTLLVHMLDYGSVRYEMGYASAIAVILFLMMLVSYALVKKLLNKLGSE